MSKATSPTLYQNINILSANGLHVPFIHVGRHDTNSVILSRYAWNEWIVLTRSEKLFRPSILA